MTREEWAHAFDETRRFMRKGLAIAAAGSFAFWVVVIFIVWRLL